jgi:hypothetical protein
MTHPDDLLAEYVDGTLAGADLHSVQRHLAGCQRCRAEVDLAGGARAALASLVEPPVPDRVGAAAIEEATRTPAVARLHGRRYRWVAGAAAAAALLVTVVALPHLGNGSGTQLAAPAAESATYDHVKPADTLEIEHRDYRPNDVAALALSYRTATPVPGSQNPTVNGASGEDRSAAFSAELVPDALTCLSTAVPDTGGMLVRLIQARFEGTPAYIGVYLERPGPDQPPDTVRVWVVARDGCAILNGTQASI